jgi:hypothetical protein
MTINLPSLTTILSLLLLSSCGDDYASYEKPAGGTETAWHRCMRQSEPIGRTRKCEDLR